ncbi:hypothetical protein EYF80_043737 [Liparis tanakae]|uniref:Uncharacterized protein n=1 Tax=Liparis tanakae TaxID=230148 RepID=A0A4Z2FZH0_9TELE|nr:hypothetical protein EYF80_043737 [Liparis tanakae]
MDHLGHAGEHQPGADGGGVDVRRRDGSGPARLVRPGQQLAARLGELQPLLAAAVGHAAVQRHVAVVRLRRLVDRQFGLLGSGGGEGGGNSREEKAIEEDRHVEMGRDGCLDQRQRVSRRQEMDGQEQEAVDTPLWNTQAERRRADGSRSRLVMLIITGCTASSSSLNDKRVFIVTFWCLWGS